MYDLTPASDLAMMEAANASNGNNGTCEKMIWFQLAVFILFYVSLIVIIIYMYCKYR